MKILLLTLSIIALSLFALISYSPSSVSKPIEIPQTFIDSKAYQTAKRLDGTIGGICLTYAIAMNQLFPDVQLVYERRHVKVLIFANDDYSIWTDSNRVAPMIIDTWVEFRN